MEKETAVKRILDLNFAGIPDELWEDDEVRDAVFGMGEVSSWRTLKSIGKRMPKKAYPLYMGGLIMPLLRKDPTGIKFIPEDMRNAEMCSLAVENNGDYIVFVPQKFRTKDLYEKAIENSRSGEVLNCIPEEYLTEELIKRVLTITKGNGLRYVPGEKRTPEICLLAVGMRGTELRYVPSRLRDKEVCITAVANDRDAFDCVPKRLRTEEICEKMVLKNPYAVMNMYGERLTTKAYRAVVSADTSLVKHVPDEMLAEAFLAYTANAD